MLSVSWGRSASAPVGGPGPLWSPPRPPRLPRGVASEELSEEFMGSRSLALGSETKTRIQPAWPAASPNAGVVRFPSLTCGNTRCVSGSFRGDPRWEQAERSGSGRPLLPRRLSGCRVPGRPWVSVPALAPWFPAPARSTGWARATGAPVSNRPALLTPQNRVTVTKGSGRWCD